MPTYLPIHLTIHSLSIYSPIFQSTHPSIHPFIPLSPNKTQEYLFMYPCDLGIKTSLCIRTNSSRDSIWEIRDNKKKRNNRGLYLPFLLLPIFVASWSNFHNDTSYLLACSLPLSLSQFAFCLGSKDSRLHWRPRGDLLFWCFCDMSVVGLCLGKWTLNVLTETFAPMHRGRIISFWSVDFLDLGGVKGRNKETHHDCGRKGHKERSYFKPSKKKK